MAVGSGVICLAVKLADIYHAVLRVCIRDAKLIVIRYGRENSERLHAVAVVRLFEIVTRIHDKSLTACNVYITAAHGDAADMTGIRAAVLIGK